MQNAHHDASASVHLTFCLTEDQYIVLKAQIGGRRIFKRIIKRLEIERTKKLRQRAAQSMFREYLINNWDDLFNAIAHGYNRIQLIPNTS